MPIVGNIMDLPPKGVQDWVHWLKHKTLYGPISSITVLGQTFVIAQDGVCVRNGRMGRSFGPESTVAQFDSLQEVEAHRFLLRVLQDPLRLAQHIQTEAGAIILQIAYGYKIEPFKRDPLVHSANEALEHGVQAATPGTWLVDIIPICAGFKRTAEGWKKDLLSLSERPYAFVRAQVESGQYRPSYLADIFRTGVPARGSEEDEVAKWTAASLYTGGADTTVSSIECFFLAMALFPGVQQKAQEEIDRVLGPSRLPKIADRAILPYIGAIVKEVLRWHPVAPMAIPHMSTADDFWGQYFIPKGSLIMPNIW
ncbi:uncharacterized protein PFLUO_LOCUS6150 [Penicillium psychrofluorescens]|uniref:uncharacterized protein n=1 Tax=Penicillium psychrofluorescens TaxID=3158075 RepID=UPI003CCDB4A6